MSSGGRAAPLTWGTRSRPTSVSSTTAIASVHVAVGGLTVEDCHSQCGTYVNRRRLQKGGRQTASDGDRLQVGLVELRVQCPQRVKSSQQGHAASSSK